MYGVSGVASELQLHEPNHIRCLGQDDAVGPALGKFPVDPLPEALASGLPFIFAGSRAVLEEGRY